MTEIQKPIMMTMRRMVLTLADLRIVVEATFVIRSLRVCKYVRMENRRQACKTRCIRKNKKKEKKIRSGMI